MNQELFFKNSWTHFPFDPLLAEWVSHTIPYARALVKAPENQQWLRCGGTWFAGVNVMKNNAKGQIEDGPVLAGNFVDFIRSNMGFNEIRWDAGQLSVCYPDYPKPMNFESEAAFKFRLNRDAAHVDGLLPEGTNRRRHLREYHGFILGIPLVKTNQGASPLVVWEGSHDVIRAAFKDVYDGSDSACWGDIDVTNLYQKTRREIFNSCKRVEVVAQPGECYLVHRLALHGVSPWANHATADSDGRMICYFRPEISDPYEWLYNL